MKAIAADRRDTCPRHLNHHFSAAFQQIAGLALEVRFEKGQRAFCIIIHQDAYQFNKFVVINDKADVFFH